MPSTLSQENLHALRKYFAARQNGLIAFIRALVETESPSGDSQGSQDVVELLVNAAASISSVTSVERISVDSFGEHLCIRAFTHNEETPGILLLGHTDTVHPRGSIKERPWRTEE